MRIALVAFSLAVMACPALAQPDQASTSRAAGDGAARDQALWADIEAQARVTDGDYEGALQAEQQADVDRREAAARDLRSSRR